MGRKRKGEENEEEEIRRKIRKWERKLLRASKKGPATSDSIIEEEEVNLHCPFEGSPQATGDSPSPLSESELVSTSPQRSPSPQPQPSLPPPPREPSPAPVPIDAIPSVENETPPEEIELEGDILLLLGEAPKVDTSLGPAVHKDVASRWQDILVKGLPKDVKDKILQEYLVPSNCDLLIAPSLNLEAKAALSEALVKRDSFLMQKQRQLGIALSALASATNLIISNEKSKQKLLKPISDACRLLCDNHFMETKSRRNLVISSTNTQLKDTLIESVRDKSWLFGENISEKLKAAKTIQKTGEDLKTQLKPAPRVRYPNKNNKDRLNFKPLHRKTDNKTMSNDNARGRQQPRATPRASATQRTTRRSSPTRTTRK